MWCAPGNAGIAQEQLHNGERVECINIKATDKPELRVFAKRNGVGLTVVGPDDPLAEGIVDFFEDKERNFGDGGLRIWGPNQMAAKFEWSKSFSQKFMEKYGIPTAQSGIFANPSEAKEFAAKLNWHCVIKADGLALGKGVIVPPQVGSFVPENKKWAEQAIDDMLLLGRFGKAGERIVIQEFLEGMEISLHALCDGKTAKLFPTSQDHKRALDGDQGLNTGGMGTYSPTPFLSEGGLAETGRKILEPFTRGCAEEGIDFRGVLYPGIMVIKGRADSPLPGANTRNGAHGVTRLTATDVRVLEFNARFGDPETQVYLTRLENDLVELLDASVSGTLGKMELKWSPLASVCVVMASGGYPGSYPKGKPILGLAEAAKLPNTKVFHAGTALKDGQIVTNGGRVLGVTALGRDLKSAQAAAYAAVAKVHFDGAHFRRDIAAKALSGIRV